MARLGISYADVVTAAAKLVDEGKSVTVDSVRQALGSTGSKSTIAPLLKRWRAEQEQAGNRVTSGLPGPLADAVITLHAQLQATADLRVTAANESHRVALAEMTQRLDQSNVRAAELTEECSRLKTQLSDAQTHHENLIRQHQSLQLLNTKVGAEIAGLNDRLRDRAAEIESLRSQVSTAREHFEHYQQSVATQRTEDRQQYATQTTRLEHELAELQRKMATSLTRLTQTEMRLEQSQADRQTQEKTIATLQKNYQEVLGENAVLANRVSVFTDEKTKLELQLQSTIAAHATANADLAAAHRAENELRDRLSMLEKRLVENDIETRETLQNNAFLKGQLDARVR